MTRPILACTIVIMTQPILGEEDWWETVHTSDRYERMKEVLHESAYRVRELGKLYEAGLLLSNPVSRQCDLVGVALLPVPSRVQEPDGGF